MTDLAEVRAEGRRLVAEYRRVTESPREYYERLAAGSRWAKWVLLHADVLLADPAPVGLTEAERRWLDATMTDLVNGYSDDVHWARPTITRLLDIIDRLSTAPVDDRGEADEPAVPCCHPSSTGVDQAPMDSAKVWRCEACGDLHVSVLGPDGITRDRPPPERGGACPREHVPHGWRIKRNVYGQPSYLVPVSPSVDPLSEESEKP